MLMCLNSLTKVPRGPLTVTTRAATVTSTKGRKKGEKEWLERMMCLRKREKEEVGRRG
jgi:hypothetical protein